MREMEAFAFKCLLSGIRDQDMYRYARSVLHVHYSYSGIQCRVTHRLCAGKRSGKYPVLTYRICPRQIPAKLSGSSATDYLRYLIGMDNYMVCGMLILKGLTF